MAFVVARRSPRPPDPQAGRWSGRRSGRRPQSRSDRYEIRESSATPSGPRARTLATFRVLTEDVLDQAEAKARGPFDRAALRERARALGAAEPGPAAGSTARRLIAELRRGERLPAVLVATLCGELPGGGEPRAIPGTIGSAVDWIGVSDAQRGEALRQLLDLGDALPPRRRVAALGFPRIESHRAPLARGA